LKLAIAMANSYKQTAVVDVLVRAGFDPNAPDVQLVTPLHRAAEEGNMDKLKELIDGGAQVSVKDVEGMTPFFFAIRGGHCDVAQFLLEANSDVDAQRNDGRSALHMAVEQAEDISVVSKVLSMGSAVSPKDARGITPLHLAVAKGNPVGDAVTRVLAEAGADLNAARNDGRSVLHQALAAPSISGADTFATMLELGANPDIKNGGDTCLHFVASEGRVDEAKQLVKHSASGNEVDGQGATALHRAAAAGHTDMVAVLLGIDGVAINTQDANGATALMEASKANHISTLKKLMEAGAETDLVDSSQKTAFMWATEKGNNEIVELLAPVANIDMKGKGGWTSLYQAAFHGNLDMVKLLISRGADTKEANDDGWAPLHAAAYSGNKDMVAVLIEGGAEVDVVDKQGTTPLMQACSSGHEDVVAALIQHKANVNLGLASNGWTPLHAASWEGRLSLVEQLLTAEADPKAFTDTGVTPLLAACSANHISVMKRLAETGEALDARDPEKGRFPLYYAARIPNLEVAKALVSSKANVDCKTNNGRTALHKAARRGHVQLVKYLIEAGADVASRDDRGDMPLHLAPGNINIVRTLLDAGSPLNVQGHVGWSPLFRFVSIGSKEIVELLVDKGSEVTLANCVGDVPLHMAASDDSVELVHLLVEKGTGVNHKGFVGRTPLHSAAAAGQIAATTALISLKADVNAKDSKGASAVEYASKKGFKEAAALIADASGVAFDESTVTAVAAVPLHISPTVTKKSSESLGVAIARPPTPPEM